MSAKFDAVYGALPKLSESELRLVNQQCVHLLRQQFDERQRAAAAQFRIGEKVTFRSTRSHQVVVITVDRINRKSLVGHTEEGVRWTVSPALCKKVSK